MMTPKHDKWLITYVWQLEISQKWHYGYDVWPKSVIEWVIEHAGNVDRRRVYMVYAYPLSDDEYNRLAGNL